MGLANILTSSINDFALEGSKLKSKSARYSAWYAKYRTAIPGCAFIELSKTNAVTIASLLGQKWVVDMAALQGKSSRLRPAYILVNLAKKSQNARKGHCRTIVENVRKLCDLMIADIWKEQS